MEIAEIISHHIDKVQNLIIVEFKLFEDDDDVVREDFIEYTYFDEFGYNNDAYINDITEDIDEWENEEVDYIGDEDKLISFLNEYYIIYPKKLPKPNYK
jgi:hypothetical protein